MKLEMLEAIRSYTLSDGRRLKVYPDENAEDPRSWDNVGKFCFRKHRSYKLPNELNFDFDTLFNNNLDIEWYYIFRLDCYEHWGIVFSFAREWMMCQFDTSQSCGFIAVPVIEDKLTGAKIANGSEAEKIARQELKEYNAYCSWDVYEYVIEKKVQRTSEDWRVEDERETDEACWWYYELDDILDEVKELLPKEI